MARFSKQSGTGGPWVDIAQLVNGTKGKLVSEAVEQEGKFGTQTVAKIRFQGETESKNLNLNKPTVNGLVDAFGEESKDWVDKVLTVQTEKMMVSGRRITALYLFPEGYHLTEDEGGYLVIEKIGAPRTVDPDKDTISEEINPEDIPF